MSPAEITDAEIEARGLTAYRRVTIGEGQPAYVPLPALVLPGYAALTRWQFTPEERQAIADGADLDLLVLTFGQPVQPVSLAVIS